MSNSDVIKIDIDRSILDEYIMRLDSAIVGGRGGSGVSGGRSIGQPKTTMWKQSITNRNLQKYNQFMSWQTRPEWLDYNTLKTLKEFKGATYNLPKNFSNFMELNQQLLKMPVKKGIKEAFLGIQFPNISREQRMLFNQLGFPTRAFYNVKRVQRGVAAGLTSPTGLYMAAATILMVVEQIKQIRADLQRQNQAYKDIFLEYNPKLTAKEYQAIKDQSTDNWNKFTNYLFGVK